MAIFLKQEITELHESVTTEEAYSSLIEATLELGELTESLLTEDFILHEALLAEEDTSEERKKGFLIKVAEKIGEFLGSIREKITKFLRYLGEAASAFVEKVKGRGGKVSVPKGSTNKLMDINGDISDYERLVTDFNGSEVEYNKKEAALANTIKAKVDAYKKAYITSPTQQGEEIIDINKVVALLGSAASALALANKIGNLTTKGMAITQRIKQLTKGGKVAEAEGAAKEAKFAKLRASGASKVASMKATLTGLFKKKAKPVKSEENSTTDNK